MDLARLRAVLRGEAEAPSLRPSSVVVDLEVFAARVGAGLEPGTLGPCAVVRRWFDGTELDGPYGEQLAKASREVTETGLQTLSGGAPASWTGLEPIDGLVCFDLETTGLSGGSGTVAFVVGFGCFEGGRFHTWQFVLPSFASERGLLAAVSEAVARAHTLVTFNGKSFDVPFMEMRWLYHRLETPMPGVRHLDLLHPARRFWGPDTGGLSVLEHRMLGFHRPDDVPGAEIPARYFRYLRTSDPAPLKGVLLHNQLDLVSLGILTGLACRLVDGGPDEADDAQQCLGLGRVFERAGERRRAVDCYERLAEGAQTSAPWPVHLDLQAEALSRVASALRRQRRYDDAAEVWAKLVDLGRPTGALEREALRALAIHNEHRVKDTRQALDFARRAYDGERTRHRLRDGEKRLSRLERRLSVAGNRA